MDTLWALLLDLEVVFQGIGLGSISFCSFGFCCSSLYLVCSTSETSSPGSSDLMFQCHTVQGFPSTIRHNHGNVMDGGEDIGIRTTFMEDQNSIVNLAVAWGLIAACCAHHAGHLQHSMGYHQYAHGSLMSAFGDPSIGGVLGAFALLFPGRT